MQVRATHQPTPCPSGSKLRQLPMLPVLVGVAALASLALSTTSFAATPLGANPTLAAEQATGPGTTDATTCHVPYGDAPAQVSSLIAGLGSAGLDDLAALVFDQCSQIGGKTLKWTDRVGDNRQACLIVPKQASPDHPLPLLTFLQGSLVPAPPQVLLNGWAPLTASADLTGDPKRAGFILLLPLGRNTHHFYPFPDEYALGWDNWYRNLDRSSPNLNVDVAAIDAFIAQVQARGIVDNNRVYMTGWSNGAAMAQLYALNTPSIAAAAVYSSPDPFADVQDPCTQTPFATTLTPLMDIHNSCDIIGICQTGTAFHQHLAQQYPNLPQQSVIVDVFKNQTSACNAACASQNPFVNFGGDVNHLIWPLKWNTAMFDWLRDHPLSAKPVQ